MERQPSSVRDPLCGMKINPQYAAATTAYQANTFTSVESSAKSGLNRVLNVT